MPFGSWLRRRPRVEGRVGVAWHDSELAVAHVVDHEDRPALDQCARLPLGPEALGSWISDQGLRGAEVVLVPPPESCLLRVIDVPEVPRDEWSESVRWMIQDLVDFDVEAAWIDVLEIPVSDDWTRARKAYAMVGRSEILSTLVEEARAAGLVPVGFDVRERALLHAADPHPGESGVAVVHLPSKSGLLAIGDGGEMHVTRAVHLGEAGPNMDVDFADAPDDADIIYEPLLLDLQRSLDYYETEFGRRPVSRVVIGPSADEYAELATYLHQNLRLPVELMDLREAFPGTAQPRIEDQEAILDAVGATLAPTLLFQRDLQPKRRKVIGADLSTLGRLAAVAAGAAALQWGLEAHQASTLSTQLSELEAQRDLVDERLRLVAGDLDAEELSAEERIVLKSLEARRASQLHLLGAIDRYAGEVRSFAGVAGALARTPVDGLWLTRIHVRDGGRALALSGEAVDSHRVPTLLEGLEAESGVAGIGFASLRLSRTEEGRIAFELSGGGDDDAEAATP